MSNSPACAPLEAVDRPEPESHDTSNDTLKANNSPPPPGPGLERPPFFKSSNIADNFNIKELSRGFSWQPSTLKAPSRSALPRPFQLHVPPLGMMLPSQDTPTEQSPVPGQKKTAEPVGFRTTTSPLGPKENASNDSGLAFAIPFAPQLQHAFCPPQVAQAYMRRRESQDANPLMEKHEQGQGKSSQTQQEQPYTNAEPGRVIHKPLAAYPDGRTPQSIHLYHDRIPVHAVSEAGTERWKIPIHPSQHHQDPQWDTKHSSPRRTCRITQLESDPRSSCRKSSLNSQHQKRPRLENFPKGHEQRKPAQSPAQRVALADAVRRHNNSSISRQSVVPTSTTAGGSDCGSVIADSERVASALEAVQAQDRATRRLREKNETLRRNLRSQMDQNKEQDTKIKDLRQQLETSEQRFAALEAELSHQRNSDARFRAKAENEFKAKVIRMQDKCRKAIEEQQSLYKLNKQGYQAAVDEVQGAAQQMRVARDLALKKMEEVQCRLLSTVKSVTEQSKEALRANDIHIKNLTTEMQGKDFKLESLSQKIQQLDSDLIRERTTVQSLLKDPAQLNQLMETVQRHSSERFGEVVCKLEEHQSQLLKVLEDYNLSDATRLDGIVKDLATNADQRSSQESQLKALVSLIETKLFELHTNVAEMTKSQTDDQETRKRLINVFEGQARNISKYIEEREIALRVELTEAKSENAVLATTIVEKDKECHRLCVELTALEVDAKELEDREDALIIELAEVKRENTELVKKLEDKDADCYGYLAEINELAATAETDARLISEYAELLAPFSSVQADLDQAREEISERDGKIAELQLQLDQENVSHATTCVEFEELRKNFSRFQAAAEELQQANLATKEAEHDAQRTRVRLTEQLQHTEARLSLMETRERESAGVIGILQSQATSLESDAKAKVEELTAEISRVHKDLADARSVASTREIELWEAKAKYQEATTGAVSLQGHLNSARTETNALRESAAELSCKLAQKTLELENLQRNAKLAETSRASNEELDQLKNRSTELESSRDLVKSLQISIAKTAESTKVATDELNTQLGKRQADLEASKNRINELEASIEEGRSSSRDYTNQLSRELEQKGSELESWRALAKSLETSLRELEDKSVKRDANQKLADMSQWASALKVCLKKWVLKSPSVVELYEKMRQLSGLRLEPSDDGWVELAKDTSCVFLAIYEYLKRRTGNDASELVELSQILENCQRPVVEKRVRLKSPLEEQSPSQRPINGAQEVPPVNKKQIAKPVSILKLPKLSPSETVAETACEDAVEGVSFKKVQSSAPVPAPAPIPATRKRTRSSLNQGDRSAANTRVTRRRMFPTDG